MNVIPATCDAIGAGAQWCHETSSDEEGTKETEMFDVYCSGHGAKVLMGMDSVRALRNTGHGPEIEWRCSCGTTGVWQARRPDRGPERAYSSY